jgi:hypothetical protein
MSSHAAKIDAADAPHPWGAIDNLLDELAVAARRDQDPVAFHERLVVSLSGVVGAQSAALWFADGQAGLKMRAHASGGVQMALGEAPLWKVKLIDEGIKTLSPRAVAANQNLPGVGSATGWLFVHPVAFPDGRSAALEVFLETAHESQTQSYLELLEEFGQLLIQHAQGSELLTLRTQLRQRHATTEFRRSIHGSLDIDTIGYTIANELRRLANCDRVSVLVPRGARFQLVAISGAAEPQRNSPLILRLEALAAAVATAGEPLWSTGEETELPEQISKPLHELLRASEAKSVAVLPLTSVDEANTAGESCGVLILEQFRSATLEATEHEIIKELSPDCASALANGLVHQRQPLARTGRWLAKAQWLLAARQLPKTVAVGTALAIGGLLLAIVPTDFYVESKGELQPQHRQDVFASEDAVVDEILVQHGSSVQPSQPTITLRRPELELNQKRVSGELQTVRQRLLAVRAELLANSQRAADAPRTSQQFTADEAELQSRERGLAAQLQLLQQEQAQLTLRSPIAGQVLTWNLDQLLRARPVSRGQSLLTIGDLNGDWVVDLQVPDKRAGYVIAASEKTSAVPIEFALTAEPGQKYSGNVRTLATRAELDDNQASFVRMTADFDKHEVPQLHPGATVTAKVYCGRRSLGFVWFHDVWNFVQSHGWW